MYDGIVIKYYGNVMEDAQLCNRLKYSSRNTSMYYLHYKTICTRIIFSMYVCMYVRYGILLYYILYYVDI